MHTRFTLSIAVTLAVLVTTGGARGADSDHLTLVNDTSVPATITLYETTNYAPTTVDTMIPSRGKRTWSLGGASKTILHKIRVGLGHAACILSTDGGDWTITAIGNTCVLKR